MSYYETYRALRNKAASYSQGVGEERIEGFGRGKGYMNTVRHCYSVARNWPFSLYIGRYDNGPTRYHYYFYRLVTPSAIPWSLSTLKHPVIDLSEARSRAWWNMQPRFVGEVDMLNFLFELKDFRDIAKALLIRQESLMTLRKKLTRLFKNNNRRKHLWDLSGITAGGTLANNFALEPLLSDWKKIATQSIIVVREAQKKFESAGERWQKSHFSEEIWREDSTTVGTLNNYWQRKGILKTSKFTATLRYMYDYKLRSDWKAFADYWGLSFSFNRAWNALPFSFLVDYVVNVGNSIKAMETDPNVNISDTQYCESLLTIFRNGYVVGADPREKLWIINRKFGTPGDFKDLCYNGHVGWRYDRNPAEPLKAPALPVLRVPKGKQILNMLALARCFL